MGQNVLVVDDSGLNLRVAMNILKEHFDVTCANSGAAAFDVIKKQMPDLILLDYHMPVMDGFQFIEKLRDREEYKDIPVFFLTGVSDAYHVKLAARLKPEGYILKSISQEELVFKLHDFFK